VSVLVVVLLQRTPSAATSNAIGNKRRRPIWAAFNNAAASPVICFVLCGLAAALAGVLSPAIHQGLSGDGRRLSAAFDRSGRDRGHKHPGRSRALSRTLVGVVLIVLLNSVLSIMDMPEAGRTG